MAIDPRDHVPERDETSNLIASKKDGTAVYDRQGEKLGTISHFLIGKRNGRVEYAVMSFGGLLGLGSNFYPLPWAVLTYDNDKGGYVVDLSKGQLDKAPSFARGQPPAFDRDFGTRVHDYYGITY